MKKVTENLAKLLWLLLNNSSGRMITFDHSMHFWISSPGIAVEQGA